MKKKNLFVRIMCLLLCGVIVLSLVPGLVFAEEYPIIGENDVVLEINDWEHKISSYTYSCAGTANDWKVQVEPVNGGEYKEINMDTAIVAGDPLYTAVEQAVSWIRNNDNQITVFVDASKLDWDIAGKAFNLKVTCGPAVKVTTFTSATSVMTGNVVGKNLAVQATAYAPVMGSKLFVPISAFYYDGYFTGIDLKNLTFAGEGWETIGKVYDRLGNIVALELDHTSYGIINIAGLGDASGTAYTGLSTRIHITESEKIYTTRLAIANKTEKFTINIPSQAEGNLTLPFSVDVFANGIIDVDYQWRAALSPSAPGMSISGKNIIITPDAIEGTYTLRIMPTRSSTIIGSLEFELKRVEGDYVVINMASPITIPSSGQTSVVLTASVFRNGVLSTTDTVNWKVFPSTMGVSLNGNLLTVASTAAAQTITLTASVQGQSSLSSSKDIELKKADTSIVPDDFEISGVLNNKWILEAPHGETKKISARALVNGRVNTNIEVGVQLLEKIPGVYIATGTTFNDYEIMANGIYEPTTLKLRLYSKVNPNIHKDIELKVEPVVEGYVFTNSTISKRAVIQAQGQIFVNSSASVNAVMAIAVYRNGELIDIAEQTSKKEEKVSGGSSIAFAGSIDLPTDISGLEVKILLMRGATIADSTELLAAPVVLKA